MSDWSSDVWSSELAISVTSSGERRASLAAPAMALFTASSRSAGDASVMAAAIGRAMHRRQPLPHLWMMTDERQGETLWRALYRLPRGAGVVFRHHSLPPREIGRAHV